MQKKRFAPLAPFLAVAGIVALSFTLGGRSAPATKEPAQIQTVEQERMAATYFRVLTFLSEVMPKRTSVRPQPEPAKGNPLASPASIELCRYWTGHDQPVDKCTKLHKRS